MNYSRSVPSSRYSQLLEMYKRMHIEGESPAKPAAATFPGHSLPAHAGRIKTLIDTYGAHSLLDYGSGKGRQYQPMNVTAPDGRAFASILEYWGVSVRCFDPAYAPFSEFPTRKFDGVISTDVLEHCPAEDVAWIIDEMFALADKFVYATIACYPARKHLPNGENAHITIEPMQWWQPYFDKASRAHGNVPYLVLVEQKSDDVKQATLFSSPSLKVA